MLPNMSPADGMEWIWIPEWAIPAADVPASQHNGSAYLAHCDRHPDLARNALGHCAWYLYLADVVGL